MDFYRLWASSVVLWEDAVAVFDGWSLVLHEVLWDEGSLSFFCFDFSTGGSPVKEVSEKKQLAFLSRSKSVTGKCLCDNDGKQAGNAQRCWSIGKEK